MSIRVHNKTSEWIYLAITNLSDGKATMVANLNDYQHYGPKTSPTWPRKGPEFVFVARDRDREVEVFKAIPGVDVEILPLSVITVYNGSPQPMHLKITNDSYSVEPAVFVEVQKHTSKTWKRAKPEVMFIRRGGAQTTINKNTKGPIELETRMVIPGASYSLDHTA
jgi:hypothetical protein